MFPLNITRNVVEGMLRGIPTPSRNAVKGVLRNSITKDL